MSTASYRGEDRTCGNHTVNPRHGRRCAQRDCRAYLDHLKSVIATIAGTVGNSDYTLSSCSRLRAGTIPSSYLGSLCALHIGRQASTYKQGRSSCDIEIERPKTAITARSDTTEHRSNLGTVEHSCAGLFCALRKAWIKKSKEHQASVTKAIRDSLNRKQAHSTSCIHVTVDKAVLHQLHGIKYMGAKVSNPRTTKPVSTEPSEQHPKIRYAQLLLLEHIPEPIREVAPGRGEAYSDWLDADVESGRTTDAVGRTRLFGIILVRPCSAISWSPKPLITMAIGNIYFIAAVAVIGGGLFGFDISSMSAILGTQAYKCYFNQGPDGPPFNDSLTCSGPTSSVQGGITAAMPAGSWLGSLLSGFISDRFGRKKSIMIGCIIWIIGSTIICASQNIGMLVAGRVINGLCVGIESAQVPVYISELAPPTKRGRLVGAQQWAITWGILILYYISYGASFVGGQNSNDWEAAVFRIPWGIQMIPAIFLFFAMFFLPESPRWLARKDRWEECHDVLTLVHGRGDPSSPFVAFEMQDIREMCALEARNSDATYLELFKPNMLNRTHLGIFTAIWSQLTGMNVMMYYVTYVFGMAGYKGNANLLASSIQYVINVLMTIPALIWLDRWGRRPTLLVGSTLMMIWMFACAGNMAANGIVQPNGIDGIPEESMLLSGAAAKGLIACTYLFVASYAPTWGPVSWVYPPELYPLRLRGKAVALATSANWATNTALGAFVPPAFENIRWKTYLIFGIFCFAMTIHVFFLFPETAGKTLEDTSFMFEDPKGIRYLGTPAWKTRVEYSAAQAREEGAMPYSEKAKFHDDDSSPERTENVHDDKIV
nr:high-affinity glucose transporter [Quercus suber]